MVTRIVSVLASVLVTAGMFMVPQQMATAGQAVNAKTVAEHMDKGKYSASEIKSYLKGLKGNEITADGRIDEILTGKTGNRVVVFVKVPGRGKEFVVDVFVDDAGKLHKGESVSCKGEYAKYNMFTVNGITLKNGKCSR
jgi:hypothetical protein